MNIPKVSPLIDSCAAMIAQKASREYNKLSPNDKRWLDPEDMLQQGLIIALEAQARYNPLPQKEGKKTKGGAKYSTFLYTGLWKGYSRVVHAPLRQAKRKTVTLLELDAPVSDNDANHKLLVDLLRSKEYLPGEELQAVESFVVLVGGVPPVAVLPLVEAFLLDTWSFAGKNDEYLAGLKEVKTVAGRVGVTPETLRFISRNPAAKKTALVAISAMYNSYLGREVEDAYPKNQGRLKILECINCSGRFTLGAIDRGRYNLAVLTCTACLRNQLENPKTCFGKQYDPEAPECSMYCHDRIVCKEYEKGESNMAVAGTKTRTAQVADEVDEISPDDLAELEIEDEAGEADDEEEAESEVETAEDEPEEEDEEEKEVKPAAKSIGVKKSAPAAQPATTAKKAQATKKAADTTKAVATKKAARVKQPEIAPIDDLYPPPPEVVRWPMKAGSLRRFAFQRAYKGVDQVKLKKDILAHTGRPDEKSWQVVVKILRRGFTGKLRRTHTWTLNEEGGKFKIQNVKYVGPPLEEGEASSDE